MLKKILINLILRWYINKNRDVHRLSPKDELRKYLMTNSNDIVEILRHEISARTVRYFEAKSDRERDVIKGEVFALKLLKDKHLYAKQIDEDDELKGDEEFKLRCWNKFKTIINN